MKKEMVFIRTPPTKELTKFSVIISQALNEQIAKDEYYKYKPVDSRQVILEVIGERKHI